MNSTLWSPRFAAVYFAVAALLTVLYVVIDASLIIVTPLILILVGMGVAVLLNGRKTAS